MKWADPKPMTRDTLLRAVKLAREQEERARAEPPRPHYVSLQEFEEYVALGICDRQGRVL